MVIVFVKFISSIAGGRLYSGRQMSGQARNYEQDNLDTYHLPYYYKRRPQKQYEKLTLKFQYKNSYLQIECHMGGQHIQKCCLTSTRDTPRQICQVNVCYRKGTQILTMRAVQVPDLTQPSTRLRIHHVVTALPLTVWVVCMITRLYGE